MFLKFLDYDAPRSKVDLSLKQGGASRVYVYDPGKGVFVAPSRTTATPTDSPPDPPDEDAPDDDEESGDSREGSEDSSR